MKRKSMSLVARYSEKPEMGGVFDDSVVLKWEENLSLSQILSTLPDEYTCYYECLHLIIPVLCLLWIHDIILVAEEHAPPFI